MLLALIWRFDFPPFMVLIIAILNDGMFYPIKTGIKYGIIAFLISGLTSFFFFLAQ